MYFVTKDTIEHDYCNIFSRINLHALFFKNDPIVVESDGINDDDDDQVKPEPVENKEEVMWYGTDYVMDVENPLDGDWKVRFENEESVATLFRNIFNWFIDAPNKTVALHDVRVLIKERRI